MKKFITLLMILLLSITLGCKTIKVEEREITLPPKPQREELKAPESVQDLANILNYYEHLVQKWEAWGDTVETIVYDKTK